ncbi:hypothetical protein N7499_000332 [Penicillium canescens]|uniref:Secreted protein n=1 Tax=Penicillium canescens TaxID=5083 RepID=A0AAD6IGK9_PENCN|nr:uncharacterized protein N7446_011469 [Penicillium canescens]KAJ6004263.1 hypothetical protein N7522_005908 [Penicillium canescens]KAJ6029187.1 hypothetical protein N7444_012174 [Penicillium canescens]KAJ6047618.1 hypothetical protein N7460_003765 [Penicillium canescens]KAJ6048786.1 hypothetical protein N7446_011469 [Penicillium canescens]KAJ6100702.1 hypothetical protein N7499_000332 [Penicillium canescens]
MHFQALPVLAAVLALPNPVFGKVSCYTSGSAVWSSASGDDYNRSEAAHAIDIWCNDIAPSTFKGGQQVKQCLEVDIGYAPNVMLRMKNGKSGDAVLEIDTCKKLLKDIVDSCERGGQDDDSDGWRPRADPGNGCD